MSMGKPRWAWLACLVVLACEESAPEDASATSGGQGGQGEQCLESPCRALLPQCGCPSSHICAVNGPQVACVVADAAAPGWNEPCSGLFCAAGFTCVTAWEGMEPAGLCHKLCESDADCGGGGLCAIDLETTQGLKACAFICDPTDPAVCPSNGTKCTPIQESRTEERWYTLCGLSGSAQAGDPCGNDGECASGLSCVTVDGTAQCVAWCHVASSDCPNAGACTNIDPPVLLGGVEFGWCL